MMHSKQVINFCLVIYTGLLLCLPFLADAGIRDTKHNLSAASCQYGGKYSVTAATECEICVFCHTPHNASPAHPLWNHELSAVTNYVPYFSNTLQSYDSPAGAPPVDGVSKLCLSCHDGTVAIGSVGSRYVEILMSSSPCLDASGRLIENPPLCTGYVGTDLSGGHPISIIFDDVLAAKRNSHEPPLTRLVFPSMINDPDVKLYPTQGGKGVQCASCHDPHGTKNADLKFWRKDTHDGVCLVCHEEIPAGDIEW
ncbi:MAG: cytochrome c3 family protein [Nitrospirota bacterium]